jgi:hypothetical protein
MQARGRSDALKLCQLVELHEIGVRLVVDRAGTSAAQVFTVSLLGACRSRTVADKLTLTIFASITTRLLEWTSVRTLRHLSAKYSQNSKVSSGLCLAWPSPVT